MGLMGVKNRTDKDQVLIHDSKPFHFAPNQVRILEGVPHDHVDSRQAVGHLKDSKGNPLPGVGATKLFDIIPLEDALKVAKPEEDPEVKAMRARAEAKAKERRALLDELKQDLEAEGWKPPQEAKKEVVKK